MKKPIFGETCFTPNGIINRPSVRRTPAVQMYGNRFPLIVVLLIVPSEA